MPNSKREKVIFDVPGAICLAIALSAMTLSLNFGMRVGWANPYVLIGLALMVIFTIILVRLESKAEEPIIPIYLFKNRKYIFLLLIGFCCIYYHTVMNAYSPLVVIEVLKQPATIAGTLQMPRTIITMILPTLLGAWVGKKASRNWKAIALAAGMVAVGFAPLIFVKPSTPVIVFLICLGITGIAEGFRSVSIIPAAQLELDQKDWGVGTSLVTFTSAFSCLVSAAVSGVVFDAQKGNIQAGFSWVVLISVIVAVIGLILTLLFIRPSNKEEPKVN